MAFNGPAIAPVELNLGRIGYPSSPDPSAPVPGSSSARYSEPQQRQR